MRRLSKFRVPLRIQERMLTFSGMFLNYLHHTYYNVYNIMFLLICLIFNNQKHLKSEKQCSTKTQFKLSLLNIIKGHSPAS